MKLEKRRKFVISIILFLFIILSSNNVNSLASNMLNGVSSSDNLTAVKDHQLAAERLQQAALFYDRWQNGRSPENFQQAIIYAALAAEIRADWDEPWFLLGTLYSEMKADEEALELAVEALIKAVELNPANARGQILLANVLFEQGRFYSAIEQYKSLFLKNENMINGMTINPFVIAYIADSRIEAGIIYLEKLEELYPNNYSIRIGRAVLLKSSGLVVEARNLLNEILIDDEIIISQGGSYLSLREKNYILNLLEKWE